MLSTGGIAVPVDRIKSNTETRFGLYPRILGVCRQEYIHCANDSSLTAPDAAVAVDSAHAMSLRVRVVIESNQDDANEDPGGSGGPGEGQDTAAFDEMKSLEVVNKGHERNCSPAQHEAKSFEQCYVSSICMRKKGNNLSTAISAAERYPGTSKNENFNT